DLLPAVWRQAARHRAAGTPARVLRHHVPLDLLPAALRALRSAHAAEGRDHGRNYCSARCRQRDARARRNGAKPGARTLPPALIQNGRRNPITTGIFFGDPGDRGPPRAWVRQSDQSMLVGREDGEIQARVYPVGDRWRVLVPFVRIIAGPPELIGGFARIEEAKAAAMSILPSGTVIDRETRARLRRSPTRQG